MFYSKTHKRFSERLNNPETFTNPEKYLGPNYQDVLNFWIYVDTLSDPEKKEMEDRYFALDYNVRWSAIDASWNAAGEVVDRGFRSAVRDVTGWEVFGDATCELIGSHKLLEQGNPLLFLPLCLK